MRQSLFCEIKFIFSNLLSFQGYKDSYCEVRYWKSRNSYHISYVKVTWFSISRKLGTRNINYPCFVLIFDRLVLIKVKKLNHFEKLKMYPIGNRVSYQRSAKTILISTIMVLYFKFFYILSNKNLDPHPSSQLFANSRWFFAIHYFLLIILFFSFSF